MRPSGARAGATLPRDLNCPRAQFYRNWLEHPQDALHRLRLKGHVNHPRRAIAGFLDQSAGVLAAALARVVFGLVVIGGLLWLAAICAMKGKWVFSVLGWFMGIFWIIGAARLAKPESRWARTHY